MGQSLVKQTVAICLLSIGLGSIYSQKTWAQVTPDTTLGRESSVVDVIGPVDFEIRGGAQRGANLFHSFRELGVPENGSIYFLDVPTTERIITRVTGNNASEILGTLGVTGDADLFLLNPQGIVFGPNSRLDINGSFLASTADRIEFDNQGFFSANNPGSPPLLTIEPSALAFLQTPPAPIQNQANQQVGRDRSGFRAILGLQVPDGESLALIGGDVVLDDGHVNALDGQVFLGGLQASGSVGLRSNAVGPQFTFPPDVPWADVNVQNNGTVFVSATGTGNIAIVANEMTLDNSRLIAGLAPGQERSPGISGPITLEATGDIQVINSNIQNDGALGSVGSGGDINIQGRNISLLENSIVQALNADGGQAGRITIQAEEDIVLAGSSNSSPPLIFNISNPSDALSSSDEPEPGKIFLGGRSLFLSNEAVIRSSSNRLGQAPNIQIVATEEIVLNDGASIQTNPSFLQGIAGNIDITTSQLNLQNGASILASTGSGEDGGNINIQADDITLTGISLNGFKPTQITSSTGGLGLGRVVDAGNITIATNQLRVVDGATISVSTATNGIAGTIAIAADVLEVRGEAQGRLLFNSAITSDTEGFGLPTGNAGNIILDVGALQLTDGGLISVLTSSSGQGGAIEITADTVDIRGTTSRNNPSGLVSQTSAEGDAGRIIVDTRILRLNERGGILASSSGATGQGGNVILRTATATLKDAFLLAQTTGLMDDAGDAGTIQFEATDRMVLRGDSRVAVETLGVGNARNTIIEANRFVIRDNATVSAISADSATGNAGTLSIQGDRLSLQDKGRIIAFTDGDGNGGAIFVTSDRVRMGDNSVLSVEARGAGRAGDRGRCPLPCNRPRDDRCDRPFPHGWGYLHGAARPRYGCG